MNISKFNYLKSIQDTRSWEASAVSAELPQWPIGDEPPNGALSPDQKNRLKVIGIVALATLAAIGVLVAGVLTGGSALLISGIALAGVGSSAALVLAIRHHWFAPSDLGVKKEWDDFQKKIEQAKQAPEPVSAIMRLGKSTEELAKYGLLGREMPVYQMYEHCRIQQAKLDQQKKGDEQRIAGYEQKQLQPLLDQLSEIQSQQSMNSCLSCIGCCLTCVSDLSEFNNRPATVGDVRYVQRSEARRNQAAAEEADESRRLQGRVNILTNQIDAKKEELTVQFGDIKECLKTTYYECSKIVNQKLKNLFQNLNGGA